MALDTRNKRGAAIGFKSPWSPVFPDPDGDLANQADRQQIANAYPGVLANGGPAPPPGIGSRSTRAILLAWS